MTDKIRDRIKKLLALAGNNPNEHEAAQAMSRAQALMDEYSIEMVEDTSAPRPEARRGRWFATGLKDYWYVIVGQAVSELYGLGYVISSDMGGHQFIGLPHQIEFAEETFSFIHPQIEKLYKTALKAYEGSLTKKQRAELRATFKQAAARRVYDRVLEIIKERAASRDSRALVVIQEVKEQIDAMLAGSRTKSLTQKVGFGTVTGYEMGAHVKLQKEVK